MDCIRNGKNLMFSGVLNEKANEELILNCVKEAQAEFPNELLNFDFQKVTHGNSTGLKIWAHVLMSTKPRGRYVNTPTWLTEQLCCLAELGSDDLILESFFACFYCSAEDKVKTVFMRVGVDIPILDDYEGYVFSLKDENGNELEPDFDPAGFLIFIAAYADRYRKAFGSK